MTSPLEPVDNPAVFDEDADVGPDDEASGFPAPDDPPGDH